MSVQMWWRSIPRGDRIHRPEEQGKQTQLVEAMVGPLRWIDSWRYFAKGETRSFVLMRSCFAAELHLLNCCYQRATYVLKLLMPASQTLTSSVADFSCEQQAELVLETFSVVNIYCTSRRKRVCCGV